MPVAPPTARNRPVRSSTRTGLAVAALVLGVLAAALALTVGFAGLYAPYSWYAVVPLAIIGIWCGVLGVGRRHHHTPAAGAMSWVGAVGGIVALVLGVWGVTNAVRAPHVPGRATASAPQVLHPSRNSVPQPPSAPTTSPLNGPQIAIGQSIMLGQIRVTVTGPDAYTPSNVANASDGNIVRAVKFTVTVTNGSDLPLAASGVDVEGYVGGQQIGRVYDLAIPAMSTDIQPGASSTFPVAFNVAAAPTNLSIQVDPQAMASTGKLYFTGVV